MEQFDVAVIGAGPAGTMVAYHLAKQGVRVVILEKDKFPRDKPCGDGVSGDGLDFLERMGLGEWAMQFPRFDTLHLSSPDGRMLDITEHAPQGECYGRTIPRRLLDMQMAQAAMNTGARLLDGYRVENVVTEEQGVKITANKQELSARMVILADGSHAPVSYRLGLIRYFPELMAMRQYLAGDSGPANRLEIHFQAHTLPGYNWLFPMGNGVVNVGTGTYYRHVKHNRVDLRKELARFISDEVVTEGRLRNCEPIGPAKAHPLRTQLGKTRVHAGRILVAGDAAGTINPLTGGGITPAMKSGQLAAQHAYAALKVGDFSEQKLSAYTQDLYSQFMADYKAARLLRMMFNYPVLVNRVFRNLRADRELALLVGYIMTDRQSARQVLNPRTLLRLVG